MAKKPKKLRTWRASLIKATPQKFLGYVDAVTEEEARNEAAREYKVPEPLWPKIVVTPEK
jgi:hypothetical protein